VIARRLIAEHRVRLPLILLGVLVFGFVLVGVFAAADANTRASSVTGNAAIAFRLLGLDPLAAWVSLGQVHPIFLVLSALFAVSVGVRSVAGELEAGTLELTMARPLSRGRYLGTHLALLVPGCALVALAYAIGALAGDRTFDAPGAPLQPSRMLLAALESALLLLAIGTLAVLVSAYSSERGRALSWVLGITIGMYAANFLLVLWEPTRDLARLTFFWYFSPGATIQRGDVDWGDVAVLAGWSVAASAVAIWHFQRRDLV
jgi:ABC-2 type transport system permease protein